MTDIINIKISGNKKIKAVHYFCSLSLKFSTTSFVDGSIISMTGFG